MTISTQQKDQINNFLVQARLAAVSDPNVVEKLKSAQQKFVEGVADDAVGILEELGFNKLLLMTETGSVETINEELLHYLQEQLAFVAVDYVVTALPYAACYRGTTLLEVAAERGLSATVMHLLTREEKTENPIPLISYLAEGFYKKDRSSYSAEDITLRQYIQDHPDRFFACVQDSWRPIAVSAFLGDVAMFSLDTKSDTNEMRAYLAASTQPIEQSILYYAVLSQNAEIIKLVLNNLPFFVYAEIEKTKVLIRFIEEENGPFISYCITDWGIAVNAIMFGKTETPLQYAIGLNKLKSAQKLVDLNATCNLDLLLNVSNHYLTTATLDFLHLKFPAELSTLLQVALMSYHILCERNRSEEGTELYFDFFKKLNLNERLLNNELDFSGAYQKVKGYNALQFAVSYKLLKLSDFLITAGANLAKSLPVGCSFTGLNTVGMAIVTDDADVPLPAAIAPMLIQRYRYHPDQNIFACFPAGRYKGMTCLHLAIITQEQPNVRIIKLLTQQLLLHIPDFAAEMKAVAVTPMHENYEGMNPLHTACWLGHSSSFKELARISQFRNCVIATGCYKGATELDLLMEKQNMPMLLEVLNTYFDGDAEQEECGEEIISLADEKATEEKDMLVAKQINSHIYEEKNILMQAISFLDSILEKPLKEKEDNKNLIYVLYVIRKLIQYGIGCKKLENDDITIDKNYDAILVRWGIKPMIFPLHKKISAITKRLEGQELATSMRASQLRHSITILTEKATYCCNQFAKKNEHSLPGKGLIFDPEPYEKAIQELTKLKEQLENSAESKSCSKPLSDEECKSITKEIKKLEETFLIAMQNDIYLPPPLKARPGVRRESVQPDISERRPNLQLR